MQNVGEHSAQTNRDEGRCESAAHIRKKSNIRRYPANKMVEVMIERNGIVCSTQKTSCSLLLSSHSSLHPYPSNVSYLLGPRYCFNQRK
ncbi:hypothetical protein RB195_014284 [Necator americanus]|uniref:Uncharacterized protein n=1 Tax=Necator americanus TaxID=51031 RepID=A0ABR1DZW5_NECAM